MGFFVIHDISCDQKQLKPVLIFNFTRTKYMLDDGMSTTINEIRNIIVDNSVWSKAQMVTALDCKINGVNNEE